MKNKKGFTLVELLVVIAIIGLLATIAFISLNSARGKARDAKRVSDVRSIQSVLELYYNDQVVPAYPATPTNNLITSGWNSLVASYTSVLPTSPTPEDSPCSSADNSYRYKVSGTGNSTYTISFCIGGATGGVGPGCVNATPTGMITSACLGTT